ncbi:uncharacterized protein LOC132195741 [Neocloeon triangulifer]|uniref:uncharacterized protein LOC132195741 n=1 Tax=Neocloeon triangulifer TaxID=2078957 RepID=UPI00286F84E9|nr:uncharacterized protein LOC132195741 [Neocloeon triangulifer]
MVLSAAPYYNAMNAATYLMTDVDLKVHTVAKLVGAHSSFHVFKTCQPFGEARFNLTISEFVTFDASNTDAAIIFFAGNSLKSKSTTTLSDADCDTQLAVGASDIGACIEQDTTAGICSTYYMDNYDTTTFQRVPLLVVNGRVQAFCSSVNCDSKLDNDDPGYFFKMSFNRQSILNIEGIVVDNP